MFSKFDRFSEVPVLALSRVVDTCSTSTGVHHQKSIGRNRFGLRFGGDERNVLKNTRESSATAVYTLIFVT
jgi:hypothetical protein